MYEFPGWLFRTRVVTMVILFVNQAGDMEWYRTGGLALAHVMACRLLGAKPFPEPMMDLFIK